MFTVERYSAIWRGTQRLPTSGSRGSNLLSAQKQVFPRDKYTAFGRDLDCQSCSTAGPLTP